MREPRFDSHGGGELSPGLYELALVGQGVAQVVVRDVIVGSHRQRVAKQALTVLPVPDLAPRPLQAKENEE